MISSSLRPECIGHSDTVGKYLFPSWRVGRCRRREHIAIHIATRGERGQQTLVDALDDRTQVGFKYTVELDALTGGDPQSVIAILGSKVVEDTPLGGSHHAAGNPAADHHDVFLAAFAKVAVVLLIRAVE